MNYKNYSKIEYNSNFFESNEVVANGLSFVLKKTQNGSTETITVYPGNTVTYAIKITNTSSFGVDNIKFYDTIASGMTYVDNSFSVNGVPKVPIINGQDLEYFIPGSIGAEECITISFNVTVD